MGCFFLKGFHFSFLALIITILLIVGCNPQQSVANNDKKASVAVTALNAQKQVLGRAARITGSVLPWKEEKLRFQVSGQLLNLHIKTPGKEVKGELRDENGKLLYSGDVIAEINPKPYLLALKEAQASLDAAKIKLDGSYLAVKLSEETIKAAEGNYDTTKEELEKLIPLDIQLSQETRKTSEKELELTEQAFQQKDTTHIKILQARSAKTIAQIQEQKAMFSKTLKEKELQSQKRDLVRAKMEKQLREAEIKIMESQVISAETIVARAQLNLEKCKLRAPFNGVVSKINVNPGTLVTPSLTIGNLILMDPVRIDISVALKRLRDFSYGSEVKILPIQNRINRYGKPEEGYVYHVQTTADPSTRTFLATIVTRNYKQNLYAVPPSFLQNNINLREFSGAVHQNPNNTGVLYVDVRCLFKDDQGEFVWLFDRKEGLGEVRKIRVKTGEGILNVITWIFRELKNDGGITKKDILLVDPPEGLKDGDQAIDIREDWLFRPGELVEVEYDREFEQGVFLPSEAIFEERGKGGNSFYVYVVEDHKNTQGSVYGLANKRQVIKKKVDDLWRIESGVESDELVVIHGCYSVDSQYKASQKKVPVHVISEESLVNLVKGYYVKETSQ